VTKDEFGAEEEERKEDGIGEERVGHVEEADGKGSKVDVVERTKWQWIMSKRAK
jgi:hypothetical protein